MKSISFAVLLLCFFTASQAQESKMDYKYTILQESSKKPDRTLPNIHPVIPNAERNYVMVSVQDEDLLRVAFYNPDFGFTGVYFDLHNPTKRDFTGMPAKYRSGVNKPGVIFADGTELDPYLPPDAQPIGSEEWPYQMRWRRVYKNYYFVTIYRGTGRYVFNGLVTAKDGQDISVPLGETSVNADTSKYFALGVDNTVVYYYLNNRRIFNEKQQLLWDPPALQSLTLIPVEEKDLPPDFPKGLVRWIP